MAYVVKLGASYLEGFDGLNPRWADSQGTAIRWPFNRPLEATANADAFRARVVRLVAPACREASCREAVREAQKERDISRADLRRSEESKDALAEQCRGLAQLVKDRDDRIVMLTRECERRAQKQAALECAIDAAKRAFA